MLLRSLVSGTTWRRCHSTASANYWGRRGIVFSVATGGVAALPKNSNRHRRRKLTSRSPCVRLLFYHMSLTPLPFGARVAFAAVGKRHPRLRGDRPYGEVRQGRTPLGLGWQVGREPSPLWSQPERHLFSSAAKLCDTTWVAFLDQVDAFASTDPHRPIRTRALPPNQEGGKSS